MFFEPQTSTGCGLFCNLRGSIWPFFSRKSNVSLREKTVKNTNLVPSRHCKRVNDSLPVDMHYSKTSLLKLPYNKARTKTRSRRGSRINIDRFPKRASKAQAFGGSGGINTSIMKNLTDFSKTVETVWIRAWQAGKARFLVEIAYYHRTTNVLPRDENGNVIVAFILKNGLVHLCIYL